jgi:hypothetical protein
MAVAVTRGANTKIYFAKMEPGDPYDVVPTGKQFVFCSTGTAEAFSVDEKPILTESKRQAKDGGKGVASVSGWTREGSWTLDFAPYSIAEDWVWQSVFRMGKKLVNITGAVYTAATGTISFVAASERPSIAEAQSVNFQSANVAWHGIPRIVVPTATANVYKLYPAPVADYTFIAGSPTPSLIQGGVQYLNASMIDPFEIVLGKWKEKAGVGGTSIEDAVINLAAGTISFLGVDDATRPWGIRNYRPYWINGAAITAGPPATNNNGYYYLTETVTAGVYSMFPPPQANETLPATAKLYGDVFVDLQTPFEMYVMVHDENLNVRKYLTGVQVVSVDLKKGLKTTEPMAFNYRWTYEITKENGDTFGEVLIGKEKEYEAFVTGFDPLDSTRRSDGMLIVNNGDSTASCTLTSFGVTVTRTIEEDNAIYKEAACGYSDTDIAASVAVEARRSDLLWETWMKDRTKVPILCTTRNMPGDSIFYGISLPQVSTNGADTPIKIGACTTTVTAVGECVEPSNIRCELHRVRGYVPA